MCLNESLTLSTLILRVLYYYLRKVCGFHDHFTYFSDKTTYVYNTFVQINQRVNNGKYDIPGKVHIGVAPVTQLRT